MMRTAEDIVDEMRQLREEVVQDVAAIKGSMGTLLNWRYYVRQHPYVTVGGAALLGALIVPRRGKGQRLDASALATELQKLGIIKSSQAGHESPSILGMVLATMAPPLVRIGISLASAHLSARHKAEEKCEPAGSP